MTSTPLGILADRVDGFEVIQAAHRQRLDLLADQAEELRAGQQALAEDLDNLRSQTQQASGPSTMQVATAPPAGWRAPGRLDWVAVTDPDLALLVLEDLPAWHNRYLTQLDAEQPPCWLWHPVIVAETLALRDIWTGVYITGQPNNVADLYRTWLPGYIERCRHHKRDCSPSEHHWAGLIWTVDTNELPDYATWWATIRAGTPPGLTERT